MAYAKPIKNKYINVTTSRVYTSCNTIPLTSTGIDMVLFTWQRKACERFANFLGWLKVKKQIPWFSFFHFIVVMQNVLHDCLYFLHVIVVMQNLLHDCWYFCPFLQFFNECCKTFLFTFISLFGIMLEVCTWRCTAHSL